MPEAYGLHLYNAFYDGKLLVNVQRGCLNSM